MIHPAFAPFIPRVRKLERLGHGPREDRGSAGHTGPVTSRAGPADCQTSVKYEHGSESHPRGPGLGQCRAPGRWEAPAGARRWALVPQARGSRRFDACHRRLAVRREGGHLGRWRRGAQSRSESPRPAAEPTSGTRGGTGGAWRPDRPQGGGGKPRRELQQRKTFPPGVASPDMPYKRARRKENRVIHAGQV